MVSKQHRNSDKPPIRLEPLRAAGNVTIAVPKSFHGPATILTTRSGSVKFSRELQTALTVFNTSTDSSGNLLKSFIGNWQDTGFAGGSIKEWTGDVLDIQCEKGNVVIQWAEDSGLVTKSGGGFIGTIKKFISAEPAAGGSLPVGSS